MCEVFICILEQCLEVSGEEEAEVRDICISNRFSYFCQRTDLAKVATNQVGASADNRALGVTSSPGAPFGWPYEG